MEMIKLGSHPLFSFWATATAIGFFAVNVGVAQISNTKKTAGAPTLVVADQVDLFDGRAREPMVVQHPDGTLTACRRDAGQPLVPARDRQIGRPDRPLRESEHPPSFWYWRSEPRRR